MKTNINDLQLQLQRTNTVQENITMCKKDDRPPHQKSRVFYCKQSSRFIFKQLTLKKSIETFVTEYVPNVKFIIS